MSDNSQTWDDEDDASDIEVVDSLDFEAVDESATAFVDESATAFVDESAEAVDESATAFVDESPSLLVGEPSAPSAAPVDADAYTRFVRLVEEAALDAGVSPSALGTLSALFGLRRVERVDGTPLRSAEVTRQIRQWQAVLRGDAYDLGECGSLPLDEWAANLVGEATGDAAIVSAVRRALRQRGVVAFGLIAA